MSSQLESDIVAVERVEEYSVVGDVRAILV
jgi:hypothetical protein